MLLHNPGGPGVSGIESVFASASYLSSVPGSGFDIVAWEPRGLGFSEPITNCSSTIHIPGIQKRDRAPGQDLPDSFFEEVIRVAKGFGAVCQDKTGGEKDAGPHMNTIVLVRDMISVLDAFARSEDGKRVKHPELLNYWGFSYGTVVGQMFASMFPDRIGRVVLDGVVDADDWMSGNILRAGTLTDDVFLAFFEYCYLAGPKMCSYYSGSSAGDMLKRFERTVRRFDVKTATRQNRANSSALILGLEGLKVLARPKLYTPTATFSQLADLLVIYEQISRNISLDAIIQMEKRIGQNIDLVANAADESLRTISCTDSRHRLYNHTLQDMKPNIRTLQQQSFLFGDWVSAESANCIGWSIEAAEKFEDISGERSTHLFQKAEHLVRYRRARGK
ncbi:hypothetical protein HYALB_00008168 [Hymenoscyphus albidus]|uniref:AB hydrolase-1 domain-containing protein n=1 Tax=Hymenoscyphus albidus TaxID=595503 RepID=A0A9N9QE17_9HELO|nr:hypothetical protein HYALB_00008168 [Hymenoscyphus albidus]